MKKSVGGCPKTFCDKVLKTFVTFKEKKPVTDMRQTGTFTMKGFHHRCISNSFTNILKTAIDLPLINL